MTEESRPASPACAKPPPQKRGVTGPPPGPPYAVLSSFQGVHARSLCHIYPVICVDTGLYAVYISEEKVQEYRLGTQHGGLHEWESLIRFRFWARRFHADYNISKYDEEVLKPALECCQAKKKFLEALVTTNVQMLEDLKTIKLLLNIGEQVRVTYLEDHWRTPIEGILFFDGRFSILYMDDVPKHRLEMNGSSLVDQTYEFEKVVSVEEIRSSSYAPSSYVLTSNRSDGKRIGDRGEGKGKNPKVAEFFRKMLQKLFRIPLLPQPQRVEASIAKRAHKRDGWERF